MTRRLEMVGGDLEFLRRRTRPPAPVGPALRAVDLFAGCGGLTLGVLEACRRAGRSLDVRWAVEWDARLAEVYRTNFDAPSDALPGRVEQWFGSRLGSRLQNSERLARRRSGPVDLLMGGPPCQGHSSLNNHTRGDDPKNALYLSMVRAAEVLEPEAVLVENVPAVERDKGDVVQKATDHLVTLGYHVDASVISLTDIGIPQTRLRHILLATRNPTATVSDAVVRASVARTRDLRWAIADLTKSRVRDSLDLAATLSPENHKRAEWLLTNDEYDLPNRLRPECHRLKDDHRYKSMYGRLRWDRPAQTITSGFGSPGQGRYLHPALPRTLTPREAARIQFFPDWFDFGAAGMSRRLLAQTIGNAVPPKLGFVLVSYLFEMGVLSPGQAKSDRAAPAA